MTLTSRLDAIGLHYIAVSRQFKPGFYHDDNYGHKPTGDVLIHLEEVPDRAKIRKLGETYLKNATSLVKKLTRRSGVFICASAGIFYEDQWRAPFKVDDVVKPIDTYGRVKVLNEMLTIDSGGTVLRLSNLFGTGMNHNNVISDIVSNFRFLGH